MASRSSPTPDQILDSILADYKAADIVIPADDQFAGFWMWIRSFCCPRPYSERENRLKKCLDHLMRTAELNRTLRNILMMATQKMMDVKYYEGRDSSSYKLDPPFEDVTLCTVDGKRQIVVPEHVLPTDEGEGSMSVANFHGFDEVRTELDYYRSGNPYEPVFKWRFYVSSKHEADLRTLAIIRQLRLQ